MAVSSCGNDDDDEEASATPRRTTTSERETTTTLDPEEVERQAVIAAREAAFQARIDSAAPPTPNPDDPELAATNTDLMLEAWMSELRALQANGFAIRYPENSQYRAEVDSVSFDEVDGRQVAYAEVCSVDDGERIVAATGEVLSGGVRTVQATEALVKEDGVWKVAERRENSTAEGVAGCAVD